jgi:hypothetical protein
MNTERLAEHIAQFELGIQCEDGSWSVDMDGNDVWDGVYSEWDVKKIERITKHLNKTFKDTDWQKVADTVNYEVGDKVKFIDSLERYPHTTIPKDATGTIANIDEDFVYVTIHDEDCAKDLAEWDGQLYLYNTPVTDFDKHEYEGLDVIEIIEKDGDQ